MRHMHFRRVAAIPACLTLLTIAAVSAAGHASPSAAALLDGAGPAVNVDFRAAADDGRPVLDLKREDVTLKVNGKAREIRSLQLVQFGGPPAITTGPSMPTPFGSNAPADAGREVLFAIDDESIVAGSEQPVKEAVRQVMSGLSAADRVGLMPVTPRGLNMAPTRQRDTIGAAVSGLVGRANMSETSGDAICRTRVTLDNLKATFTGSTGGSATTVVFFSSGLTPPTGGVTAALGKKTQMGADVCAVTTQDYTTVGNAALASNVNFYVVFMTEGKGSAVSTSKTSSGSDMQVGVNSLAGQSGAQTILLSGNTEGTLARIGRDTSAYYIATFEPDASERNGSPARVELRVGRDAVKVRARSEVMLAKGSGTAPTPDAMMRVATVFRDLPLRATGYVKRNPGDDKMVQVLAVFEPAEPSTKLASAAVALFDEKGKRVAQQTLQANELSNAIVRTILPVSIGTYRMRVAATDVSGRAGTADYDVRAEIITAAPLKLSGLVLGTADGGPLQPRLIFGAAQKQAVGYLEVYGVSKGAAIAVSLELAATPDGPAMATTEAIVQAGGPEDMRIAYDGFAIDGLAPGDYLMRAIVTVDGKPVGRSTHTLRKIAQ
jgi:hypothetical protein